MLGKLAFRNVKRSVKDYLVYLLTMTFVTALMFAFNTVLFSKDIQQSSESAGIMAAIIGLATVFCGADCSVADSLYGAFYAGQTKPGIWYLPAYWNEEKGKYPDCISGKNILLGALAFGIGLILGGLLQQVLLSVFVSYDTDGLPFFS